MARKSTIKLLLINETDNEGERLVSLFRNAGRVARAQKVGSAEELHKALDKDEWDLLIAADRPGDISIQQALEKIAAADIDLPTLVLLESRSDIKALMAAGASDVVAGDDSDRLIFAALRELTSLEKRRELLEVRVQLTAAEERCEQLLAQSQDAIAYVTDGMITNANAEFAKRFGHDDPDDLQCQPIIDLIFKDDHEKFKSLLKTQLTSESGSTELPIQGVNKHGESFDASITLSSAVLDGEPCVHLLVRSAGAGASNGNGGGNGSTLDTDTALPNRDSFLHQLPNAVRVAGGKNCSLLMIAIDQFHKARSQYGFGASNAMMADFGRFLRERCGEQALLARYCDDAFALLLDNCNEKQARERGEELRVALAEHIAEIGGRSLQRTATIGVTGVDSNALDSIADNAFSAIETARAGAGSDGIGNTTAVYVPVKEKKKLGAATNDTELDGLVADAINDRRFLMVFQPVISIRGATGEYYEVSTRMLDEHNKELSPKEFLASLAFSKPNTRLDRWIILEATKQLAEQRILGHDTRLFINLTANALQDASLVPWLGVALKAGNVPPESVVLQFCESDISENLKTAKTFAEALAGIRCGLAIAGFGEAADPLKHFTMLGAGFAKIAPKFTRELESGQNTEAVKALITSISETQGRSIISAVENAAAMALLWQLGVDYIQGGYLAPPSQVMDYEFSAFA